MPTLPFTTCQHRLKHGDSMPATRACRNARSRLSQSTSAHKTKSRNGSIKNRPTGPADCPIPAIMAVYLPFPSDIYPGLISAVYVYACAGRLFTALASVFISCSAQKRVPSPFPEPEYRLNHPFLPYRRSNIPPEWFKVAGGRSGRTASAMLWQSLMIVVRPA